VHVRPLLLQLLADRVQRSRHERGPVAVERPVRPVADGRPEAVNSPASGVYEKKYPNKIIFDKIVSLYFSTLFTYFMGDH
jgi:hypothetical protein